MGRRNLLHPVSGLNYFTYLGIGLYNIWWFITYTVLKNGTKSCGLLPPSYTSMPPIISFRPVDFMNDTPCDKACESNCCQRPPIPFFSVKGIFSSDIPLS